MAWFSHNEDTKTAELDLHEYAATTALDQAQAKIAEAWLNGYRVIKAIHGAPGIKNPDEVSDRGIIKFELRSLLESGGLASFVEAFEMVNGSTSITLKWNPSPRSAIWSPLPEAEYDRSARTWQRRGPNRAAYTKQQAQADAETIVLAIVQDLPHPAVTKRQDRWVVTMVRAIPNAEYASQMTLSGQRRRLKEAIIRKIEDYPQFEQSDSGSQLAFRLRSSVLSIVSAS